MTIKLIKQTNKKNNHNCPCHQSQTFSVSTILKFSKPWISLLCASRSNWYIAAPSRPAWYISLFLFWAKTMEKSSWPFLMLSHPARVVSVQWDEVSLMKMRPPCRTWLLPGGSHHLSSLPYLPATADYTPSHKEVHVILHTVLLLTDWELLPRIIFCLPSFFKHNSRSEIDRREVDWVGSKERWCPDSSMSSWADESSPTEMGRLQ